MSKKKIVKTVLKGMAMGAADTIPGVSGSTIAVILGIYDSFIEAIKYSFGFKISKRYVLILFKRKQIFFLLTLAVGIVIGSFIFSRILINFNLLTTHYQYSAFFFMGLIIGSVPIIFNAHHNMSVSLDKVFFMLVSFLFVIGISLFSPLESTITSNSFTQPFYYYAFLFISGFIASTAMLVPGISGSFMLLLLGSYYTVINAISNLDLYVLCTIGLGSLIGALTMANVMVYFLKKAPAYTYYAIIGLILGSLYKLWPTDLVFNLSFGINLFCLAIGLMISRLLAK
jgi:putative membrane protein